MAKGLGRGLDAILSMNNVGGAPAKTIGEMVMERLKKVDEVAYVRYASVYRSFKDLSSFMSELKQMMKANKLEKTDKPTGGQNS
ncbi:MAG: hypothetical protein IKV60_04860 [Rikenellaceae bacterium]|nr:hypothetical protein [Rikenellaceae bacterium]